MPDRREWSASLMSKPTKKEGLVWVLRYAIESPLKVLHIAYLSTASASDVMVVLLVLPKIMELNMNNGRSAKREGIDTLSIQKAPAIDTSRGFLLCGFNQFLWLIISSISAGVTTLLTGGKWRVLPVTR